jgi:hypothetical protein
MARWMLAVWNRPIDVPDSLILARPVTVRASG